MGQLNQSFPKQEGREEDAEDTDVEEELDRLTGPDTVKEEVRELVTLVQNDIKREKKGLKR